MSKMIKITQGEGFLITSQFKADGVLEPLTDWDIKAAVRLSVDGTVLYEPIVTKTTLGTFTIAFDSANTALLPVQELVLAIRLAKTNGPIKTVNQRLYVYADRNW